MRKTKIVMKADQHPSLDTSGINEYNHSLISAFNWYNAEWSYEKYRDEAVRIASSNPEYKKYVSALKNADYFDIRPIAVYLHLQECGEPLGQEEVERLHFRLQALTAPTIRKIEKQCKDSTPSPKSKTNEEIKSACYEVDQLLDNYVTGKCNGTILGVCSACKTVAIKNEVKNYIDEILADFRECLVDKNVREEYSNITLPRIKQIVKLFESFDAEYNKFKTTTASKSTTVSKRKRAPTAAQLTKKMLIMRTIPNTNILGFPAEKFIGSQVMYVYNYETRKLIRYVAQKGMTLSANGMSVVNYDPELSCTKTIRKPEEFFADKKGSFTKTEIKTKFDKLPQGAKTIPSRLNSSTVILSC